MRARLILLLALALPPGTAAAGSGEKNAGTSAGEFLKLGADARGIAMGGEMSAASEDAAAVFWNPAGLARLDERHATLTHSVLFHSVFYDFAAYAHPVRPLIPARRREMRPSVRGTIALGILYLNAGSLTERDNTGQDTGGSFTPRDTAVIAAWGASFSESVDLGLALKYIDSRIQATARTGTIDLGARYNTHIYDWPWVLAFNIRNLGWRLRYRNQSDPLPTSYRFGSSLRPLETWLLTLDVVVPRDNDIYPAFGTEVELPVHEKVETFLRGGFNGRTTRTELDGFTSLSFGFGLGIDDFGFDYAFLPFGALGITHRLSLNYTFGR